MKAVFLDADTLGGDVDLAPLEAVAVRPGQDVIAGAGVDVLSGEPPVNGNPLLAGDIPNLLVTPHCAWASREARQRMVSQSADNLRAFRDGTLARWVV